MAKAEEGSVELVKADDKETLALVLAGMSEAQPPSEEEQQQVRFSIIADMLAAETEEDLWKDATTWSSKDSVGRSFRILDARAWRSKRGQAGGFLSCPAIDLETGEQGILNTGAMRLAARIGWYKLHGKLPVSLTIVERGQTADGFKILDGELVS